VRHGRRARKIASKKRWRGGQCPRPTTDFAKTQRDTATVIVIEGSPATSLAESRPASPLHVRKQEIERRIRAGRSVDERPCGLHSRGLGALGARPHRAAQRQRQRD